LSGLVSKYVGETTKNLKRIFDLAEMRNYILFFDEGDTIFSKRVDQSQSGNQNASYANQQVAYLLQRIEDYPGVVIVATNLRSNMDEAFSRRFQSTVFFKPPSHPQLIETWQKLWPADQIELSPEIKIDLRLKEHQYTVASLVNIIQRLLLRAHRDNRKIITASEFNQCFKDEQYK
jgi:SpoVK/Ycf46/Vps4 family AAA+-type ATPase